MELCLCDFVYDGVFEVLKGEMFDDWELVELLLFCFM